MDGLEKLQNNADVIYGRTLTKTKVFFSLLPMPQEAPLHLLGRNHPLVKEAERIPFKQPDFEDPFSIYYNSEDLAADDYLLYNYDYVDEPEHGLQKGAFSVVFVRYMRSINLFKFRKKKTWRKYIDNNASGFF